MTDDSGEIYVTQTYSTLMYIVLLTRMNSVNDLAPHEFLIAQLIECLPSVWEVMGLIPLGDSDIFFVPCLCHVDQFTFCLALPSLKCTIFIHL